MLDYGKYLLFILLLIVKWEDWQFIWMQRIKQAQIQLEPKGNILIVLFHT